MSLHIVQADCREALREMEPDSIDCCAYVELIRKRCAQPSLFEEGGAA